MPLITCNTCQVSPCADLSGEPSLGSVDIVVRLCWPVALYLLLKDRRLVMSHTMSCPSQSKPFSQHLLQARISQLQLRWPCCIWLCMQLPICPSVVCLRLLTVAAAYLPSLFSCSSAVCLQLLTQDCPEPPVLAAAGSISHTVVQLLQDREFLHQRGLVQGQLVVLLACIASSLWLNVLVSNVDGIKAVFEALLGEFGFEDLPSHEELQQGQEAAWAVLAALSRHLLLNDIPLQVPGSSVFLMQGTQCMASSLAAAFKPTRVAWLNVRGPLLLPCPSTQAVLLIMAPSELVSAPQPPTMLDTLAMLSSLSKD